jgi:predicted Zn finger-like uncharacterized protein
MTSVADPTFRGRRLRMGARALFWLGVLGFVAPLPVVYWFPTIYDGIRTNVFWWWAAPWFAIVVLSGLYLHNAKCPRCQNRFAVRNDGLRWNDFTSKCLNCGLHLNDGANHAL